MRGRVTARLAAASFTLVAAVAQANWSSKSQLGFVMARGNSETETANARFELVHEVERWKNSFRTGALYGETSKRESAERWDASWQIDHKFSERTFIFGALRHEDDRFSGFDYQSSVSTGIGRSFIDTEQTKLSAQLGIGARRLRPEVLVRDEQGFVIDRIPGEHETDAAGNARVQFEHALTDTAKILNLLQVESGRNNTLTQNELALQVQMNKTLALSLGFNVRNNSKPPGEQKGTDTLTTVNLVYELK